MIYLTIKLSKKITNEVAALSEGFSGTIKREMYRLKTYKIFEEL